MGDLLLISQIGTFRNNLSHNEKIWTKGYENNPQVEYKRPKAQSFCTYFVQYRICYKAKEVLVHPFHPLC